MTSSFEDIPEFFGDGEKVPTNWKKEKHLGSGAVSDVYLAKIQTHEDVNMFAVKQIKNWNIEDKQAFEDNLGKETSVLKALSHERIIQYYGFCAAEAKYYLFVEFMPGGSLAEFIEKNVQVYEDKAKEFTKQILEGLTYLHERGVHHRDINSNNILLTDTNNVKLADISFTRDRTPSIRFMAPEMITTNKYRYYIDIWSVGCVLLHMLTGKHPFPNLDSQQVLYALYKGTSPAKDMPIPVSKRAHKFLRKTFTINCKKRPTAASLIQDDFITPPIKEISAPFSTYLRKNIRRPSAVTATDLNVSDSRNSVLTVRTVCRYKTNYVGHLSFDANQLIHNVEKLYDPDWLWGTLDGKTGYIPKDCVKIVKKSDSIRKSWTEGDFYRFEINDDEELADEVVLLTLDVNKTKHPKWLLRNLDAETGNIPRNFVKYDYAANESLDTKTVGGVFKLSDEVKPVKPQSKSVKTKKKINQPKTSPGTLDSKTGPKVQNYVDGDMNGVNPAAENKDKLGISQRKEDRKNVHNDVGEDSLSDEIRQDQIILGERLNSGYFAEVIKGTYHISGSNTLPVAVKTILANYDPAEEKKFLCEANLMKQLNHHHIVRLIGVSKSPSIILVLELAELGQLKKYLEANLTIKVWHQLELMVQICKGMSYLESMCVVHRDLAARNVLLFTEHFVKISDFGMSKKLDNSSAYHHLTENEPEKWPLRWYPLECLKHHEFTSKSDVWSFGVTMWEIMSNGAKPYDRQKAPQIMRFLESGNRLSQPNNCEERIYEIMLRCWESHQDLRPSFCELKLELQTLFDEFNNRELEKWISTTP